MPTSITPLALPLPLGMGAVNAYLLRAGGGFVLVDTGTPRARRHLHATLEGLGCRAGALRLIVITHGDFDHSGNAAYLRRTLGSPIGMHAQDAPMAELGDMFANRMQGNRILRELIPRLIGFGQAERFTPDVLLEDGASLETYGLAARVIHLPGHSSGSIGILTAEGDLLCGDLLENTKQPGLSSILADRQAALASLDRLHSLAVKMIYPGHGAPFPLEQLARMGAPAPPESRG